MYSMLSNDVKVWTAIHTTIDACAQTSSSCDKIPPWTKKGKG